MLRISEKFPASEIQATGRGNSFYKMKMILKELCFWKAQNGQKIDKNDASVILIVSYGLVQTKTVNCNTQ